MSEREPRGTWEIAKRKYSWLLVHDAAPGLLCVEVSGTWINIDAEEESALLALLQEREKEREVRT